MAAIVGGGLAFAPSGSIATARCPDGHIPSLAVTHADRQKDHNGNQVVCKRVSVDGSRGGPDDTFDDLF